MRLFARAVVAVVLILLAGGLTWSCAVAPQAEPLTASRAPTALPADGCATPSEANCIRAVYRGAPDDYVQVQDIPDSVIIQPDEDGRYQVERGQQITVVTAALLPTGYTRFYPQRSPRANPPPTSHERLVQPVGTSYTFTVATDERSANLITFELTAARPRPGQKPELGDVVVATEFLVPTLRYDTLDISGAAATAGSYAFLKTAGDAASAIGNFSAFIIDSVELRVHPTDASGSSRAAFYDTVQAGDTFDYRTNGLNCGFRFKVTSVAATTTPRTFGIEDVASYGGYCGDSVDDPGAARDVQFAWAVRPGIEVSDGVRLLLYGEPVGEGTYRLEPVLPYVIDVPAGSMITFDGIYENEPEPDNPNQSLIHAILIDAETGSMLFIDPTTGTEIHRIIKSPAATALFDQIMASIRTVN